MSIAYRRASSTGLAVHSAKVDDDMGKKIRKRIAIYSAFIFGGKSYSVEYNYSVCPVPCRLEANTASFLYILTSKKPKKVQV